MVAFLTVQRDHCGFAELGTFSMAQDRRAGWMVCRDDNPGRSGRAARCVNYHREQDAWVDETVEGAFRAIAFESPIFVLPLEP
ncbi:hypothetical protein D3C80_2074710 [compost metagenome]